MRFVRSILAATALGAGLLGAAQAQTTLRYAVGFPTGAGPESARLYAEAVDESGVPIEGVDPLRDELVPIAQRQKNDPTAFLDNRRLFGDMVEDPRFRDPYLAALDRLHSRGSRETVAWLLSNQGEA